MTGRDNSSLSVGAMGAQSSLWGNWGGGCLVPPDSAPSRFLSIAWGTSLQASARGSSAPDEEHSCSVKGHEQRRLPLGGILIRSSHASPGLRTPSTLDLLPSHPLTTPLRKVLALWNQTLMNRTGQHRDALPADLIAEVLTGDADGARAGWAQDIHIEVVPFLDRRGKASGGHR